jgi:tol-pal system protein YbgF
MYCYRRRNTVLACAVLVGAVALPLPVPAQKAAPLEQRVDRLERLLSSSALMDLLSGVQDLQSEIRELRGEVERQGHAVEQLKQRQRELYEDIDRRLRGMEAGGAGVAAATPTPAVPPESPATAAGQTSQAGVASSPGVTLDQAKEQEAYQQAFNLLKEGRYDQAIKAFQAFQAQFPGGRYADNAQYWLGEAYYVTRQFPAALTEFDKLVQGFPTSTKLAGAKLKIGYIYDELGDAQKARQVLSELVAAYPKTTAARLAQERLQRMKVEEH